MGQGQTSGLWFVSSSEENEGIGCSRIRRIGFPLAAAACVAITPWNGAASIACPATAATTASTMTLTLPQNVRNLGPSPLQLCDRRRRRVASRVVGVLSHLPSVLVWVGRDGTIGTQDGTLASATLFGPWGLSVHRQRGNKDNPASLLLADKELVRSIDCHSGRPALVSTNQRLRHCLDAGVINGLVQGDHPLRGRELLLPDQRQCSLQTR